MTTTPTLLTTCWSVEHPCNSNTVCHTYSMWRRQTAHSPQDKMFAGYLYPADTEHPDHLPLVIKATVKPRQRQHMHIPMHVITYVPGAFPGTVQQTISLMHNSLYLVLHTLAQPVWIMNETHALLTTSASYLHSHTPSKCSYNVL